MLLGRVPISSIVRKKTFRNVKIQLQSLSAILQLPTRFVADYRNLFELHRAAGHNLLGNNFSPVRSLWRSQSSLPARFDGLDLTNADNHVINAYCQVQQFSPNTGIGADTII